MGGFVLVIVIALLVEALVQVIKGMVPDTAIVPAWTWPVISAVLGILVCVLAGVDALLELGVQLSVPYVGSVLTGVIVSRGASFVHDLWGKINGESIIDVQAPVDVYIEGMTVKPDDPPSDPGNPD